MPASFQADAAVDQSEDRCHKVLMNMAELFSTPGLRPGLKPTKRKGIAAGVAAAGRAGTD
jgi:hypothetical protein